MKRSHLIFAITFAILVALIIALLATGLMAMLVVEPVILLVATVAELVNSLPQPLLWMLIIVVGATTLLRALPFSFGEEDPAPPIGNIPEGRVTTLTRWFQNADEGDYFRKRLLRALVDVALAAREYEEVNEERIAALLRSEKLGLPEHIRLHLLGALRGSNLPDEKKRRIPAFFASATSQKSIYNKPEVLDFIQHLEKELEIHHDGD